jgi:formylglycine-generating enzyme required for sulfatase activity
MQECPTCSNCFPDDVKRCPNDGAGTTPSIRGEPIIDSRYRLEKRLGTGGMGIVFKANHVFLKSLHAIKIILPDLVGNDPMLITRFRQEALAAAAIRHQNIIAVTDFGVVGDTMPFLVMEFVSGKSLQDIMAAEGAMSPVRAFELMEPICAGIAAAHRQRIIHRDLKPLNVMIQEGMPVNDGVKVLDFGLAKIKSGELLGSFIAAKTTGLMGSPLYMAPEQWSEDEPDARSDIYSLGVMFYQMLCGEVPFKGNSVPAIMKKHLTEKVPSLASKGVEVPPQIEAAVRHALEKEPEHRTASAEEFIGELRAAMATASATLQRTGEALGIEASKTILAPPEGSTTGDVFGKSTFEPLPGTDTRAALLEDEQKTAASMSGGTAVADSEVTKTLLARADLTAGKNIFVPSEARTFPRIDVSLGPKPRKSSLPIVLTLSVVLLIGGGIGIYFVLRSNLFRPSAPSKLAVRGEASIKLDLIYIPGGTFQMGRDDGPAEERPAHDVTVKPFFMQRTEVTNADYLEFVRATKHPAPTHWVAGNPPFGQDQWPVVNVSVDDANSYAEWLSKPDSVKYQLPTEEEWEYAARNGDKDNLYPWGNDFQEDRAVLGERLPRSVGSLPNGQNRWAIVDLIGNVWEWTSTTVRLYPGNIQNGRPPKDETSFIMRGGSYASTKNSKTNPITSTFRDGAPGSNKYPFTGFRLVRPIS